MPKLVIVYSLYVQFIMSIYTSVKMVNKTQYHKKSHTEIWLKGLVYRHTQNHTRKIKKNSINASAILFTNTVGQKSSLLPRENFWYTNCNDISLMRSRAFYWKLASDNSNENRVPLIKQITFQIS